MKSRRRGGDAHRGGPPGRHPTDPCPGHPHRRVFTATRVGWPRSTHESSLVRNALKDACTAASWTGREGRGGKHQHKPVSQRRLSGVVSAVAGSAGRSRTRTSRSTARSNPCGDGLGFSDGPRSTRSTILPLQLPPLAGGELVNGAPTTWFAARYRLTHPRTVTRRRLHVPVRTATTSSNPPHQETPKTEICSLNSGLNPEPSSVWCNRLRLGLGVPEGFMDPYR